MWNNTLENIHFKSIQEVIVGFIRKIFTDESADAADILRELYDSYVSSQHNREMRNDKLHEVKQSRLSVRGVHVKFVL